jgi:hypothetical protein
MKLTPQQEKMLLAVLVAGIVLLNIYFFVTAEKPKTVPLAFPPGSVARSAVRLGTAGAAPGADPLSVFLVKREEKFPGVSRDIFRMENPASRPKAPAPAPVIVAPPTPPAPPERSPEEIAADQARADLSKFRFLGYLTEKDNTLFLSKEGELFIVKSGDKLLKNYKVKEASKDYVVLLDTVTHVEVRIELSGSETQPAQPPLQPRGGRF